MSTLRVPRVKTRDDVVWVVFCAVVCEGEVCVSAAVCDSTEPPEAEAEAGYRTRR